MIRLAFLLITFLFITKIELQGVTLYDRQKQWDGLYNGPRRNVINCYGYPHNYYVYEYVCEEPENCEYQNKE